MIIYTLETINWNLIMQINCVVLPARIINYSEEELIKMMYDIGEAHGNSFLIAIIVYKANTSKFGMVSS